MNLDSRVLLPLALSLTLLAGCHSLRPANPLLDQARVDYRNAQDDPAVRDLARIEFRRAGETVTKANEAWLNHADPEEVDRLARLGSVQVAIAQETGTRMNDEQLKESSPVAKSVAIPDSMPPPNNAAAIPVRVVASDLKPGERSGKRADLLFDSGGARLDAAALRTIDRLAELLNRYPLSKANVRGFTDSTGDSTRNAALSERRADAARTALLARGVTGDRVARAGMGQALPVADNRTAAGRQMNRRVEIVIQLAGT